LKGSGIKAENLFGEWCGYCINHVHHPEYNVITLQAETSIHLRLAADKPDQCGIGGVVLERELFVLIGIDQSKNNWGIGAKNSDLVVRSSKCFD
jgi:hypothetical protein